MKEIVYWNDMKMRLNNIFLNERLNEYKWINIGGFVAENLRIKKDFSFNLALIWHEIRYEIDWWIKTKEHV